MSQLHNGHIALAGQVYPYRIRKSRRARRLVLSVDPEQGIEVVIPYRVSYKYGQAFLRERSDWLRQAVDQLVVMQTAYMSGHELVCFGQTYQLQIIEERRNRPRVARVGTRLNVQVAPATPIRPLIAQWYTKQARLYFNELCEELSQQLGVSYTKVRIANQRTRWGSCSPHGILSFNWRLALAPPSIAYYVAAHEVAHLKHLNHSATFWQAVAKLDPHYTRNRQWLRKHGHTLRV